VIAYNVSYNEEEYVAKVSMIRVSISVLFLGQIFSVFMDKKIEKILFF
jgi:hypothetical protein